MALIFSKLAEHDLADIAEYIGQNSPERAVSFIGRIRGRCDRLRTFPKAAPLQPDIGDNVRRIVSGRYLIFYEEDGTDVVIQRIIHAARDYRMLF